MRFAGLVLSVLLKLFPKCSQSLFYLFYILFWLHRKGGKTNHLLYCPSCSRLQVYGTAKRRFLFWVWVNKRFSQYLHENRHVSGTICKKCVRKLYPDFWNAKKREIKSWY